jgi:integrase
LAKATQRKRYGHLRTFFRWCMKEGLLRTYRLDDVAQPEKPNKLPKAITADELDHLCETVKEDYRRKRAKNWIRPRELIWRIPIFSFCFYTGMRGSEIARLRWGASRLRERPHLHSGAEEPERANHSVQPEGPRSASQCGPSK